MELDFALRKRLGNCLKKSRQTEVCVNSALVGSELGAGQVHNMFLVLKSKIYMKKDAIRESAHDNDVSVVRVIFLTWSSFECKQILLHLGSNDVGRWGDKQFSTTNIAEFEF